MKRLTLGIVLLLAMLLAACSQTPGGGGSISYTPEPFAVGWSGPATDQYGDVIGVAFGTQTGTGAIASSSSYALAMVTYSLTYPNTAIVRLTDTVGDYLEFTGTYDSDTYSGTWTSSLNWHGGFTFSKNLNLHSLSIRGNSTFKDLVGN